ncbi:MAG: flagellar assembly protein FliX [Rhodothalassiaceae bacterium]
MKVQRTSGSGPSSSVKKSGRGSAEGGGFAPEVQEGQGAEAAAPLGRTGPVASVDALLAVQEAGRDDSQARKRALSHARDLLDLLEEVRVGLLMGAIPKDRLERLAHMARQRRDSFLDPRLAGILDEIELRAEVELAKLSRI